MCVCSSLGGLNRAVGAALWGAVVPVEQQAGDCKANEGARDSREEGVYGGGEWEQHADEPEQQSCRRTVSQVSRAADAQSHS